MIQTTPIICLVASARPNFVKLAPVVHALTLRGDLPFEVVHTGQHYDDALSGSFFRRLGMPAPAENLGVGSGSQAEQTARTMERFEQYLIRRRPRAVIVFGDVNGTMACALTAAKQNVPVAHVEAGLRSFDRTMPEEINRLVTDAVSSLLLVSEPSGSANLRREGVADDRVHLVGNTMIDSLERLLPAARQQRTWHRFGLAPREYGLVTMHRPANVDSPEVLARLWNCLQQLAEQLPLVFPVHPRTRQKLRDAALDALPGSRLILTDSVDYLDSLCLQSAARMVLTDSGGMQEETSVLGVPCLTLRSNTERPITVEQGTSVLVGNHAEEILAAARDVLEGRFKQGGAIALWDGRASERIVRILEHWLAPCAA